ncbi:hypothetical protein QTP86_001670 [Hemibagrus guttatus]|nr:hypothetical protein QTP86_001670 [Hemibagrus guttatus]
MLYDKETRWKGSKARSIGAGFKLFYYGEDMYERSRTVVRCAVGQTEEFNVEVGLHQGSALSPFLFAIVMDQLSEEVRQESPWTMMFADDIVICSESREQVEENLERWRFALERRGMKVSRSKTEYMCVNEREGSGTVRLQGEEVKKVQEFKYLGSTVQSNGECGKEKISARIKGKVYRTVVRPAMLYGLETVSLKKRQESELEVAELKMLREARLRWFGHVQRRESEYIGRRMLDMELPGRRQRGRPKRRGNTLHQSHKKAIMPTTRRKEHKGPVQCVLGSSHRRGPRRPKPWTKNLAFGTWNVTSLGGKEPELVREVERYWLEIVWLASTQPGLWNPTP